MPTIRYPQFFWSGLLFLAIGGFAVFVAQDYRMGTTAQMGPGYFPTAVGTLLAAVGLISVIRSFVFSGPALSPLAWQPLCIVAASIAGFGLLIERAGLVPATIVLVIGSAYAGRYFRLRTAIMLAVVLAVFCALIFVRGLGVQMAILKPWL